MKPLKNIGIFLDLSETDEFLLHYFKKLDDVFEFDSLTLIHFVALHVLKAGFQYFPYFINQEKYQKTLRAKAESTFKKIQKKTGLAEELICVEDSGNHISRSIHEYAAEHQANLIIIGNKGNADADDLLIGSVAERLTYAERKVPILIVKPN